MDVVGPKKFWLMKNLHDVLHGIEWITFYALPGIVLGPLKRGRFDASLGNMANS
jgi:hypothetical protein